MNRFGGSCVVSNRVRAAAAFVMIALLGVLTAFALPRSGHAANPLLIATVDDSFSISLKSFIAGEDLFSTR